MIGDPWFYLAALPAVLIAGISKGGFGGGLVVMSVPLLALVCDPRLAAAVMLPQLLLMDAVAVRAYRKTWDRSQMKLLAPAALLGVAAGTISFSYLNASWIRLIIAVTAVGFCLNYWFGAKKRKAASGVDPAPAVFWGALAGFTSFVAHAGGPPLSIYLLPRKLDKTVLVGTMTIFFAVANLLKLGAYGYLGQLTVSNVSTAMVLLPLSIAGIYLGIYLHHRVNETLFYRVCYTLLFLTGLKLLVDGLHGVLN